MQLLKSSPGTYSAVERFVAKVAPIADASAGSFTLTTGGKDASFIIQKIASVDLSNLYSLFIAANLDLTVLPFPFKISSVTGTILPSASFVAPQF